MGKIMTIHYLSLPGTAMQNVQPQKPKSFNMTVKLGAAERDRLALIATAKKRTPHYLMKEAIQNYLEQEEAEQRFIDAAKTALNDYKTNGQHITLEEFSAWAKEIRTNPQAQMPPCHT
jgi:predicted transcriptional regulator